MGNILLIPKGKCLLNYLREMGERTRDSWILIHENVVKQIEETSDYQNCEPAYIRNFIWEKNSQYPQSTLGIDISHELLRGKEYVVEWYAIEQIMAKDIAFRNKPKNPDEIIRLKMEE